jgi:hypothetical protein
MDGEGADNDVERSIGEWQRGDGATDEGRNPGIAGPDRVGLGAHNHRRVQVEAGDLETLLGQPDRQVTWSGADSSTRAPVGLERPRRVSVS